ncbi:hypothetical protein SKAU_G00158380 [Synaphobranchus kaupii]|uniref:G-protein coupled receptors family 3 profile domain-containing protein n=1 Tax=Synaphobranchus kaupii TaxID=118154 RepID=A0A9Q1IZ54_SYNKA|nr:hypothetical protein SKAU_G00158380 [Synaphobranchus kaupii]
MRFAVEEINNSTTLLPDVRLGYEIFDYCSDNHNFNSVLEFLVANGSVPVKNSSLYEPKIISVTGPFGTTQTISVAPLFMSNLIPMVAHGATSVQLSNKQRFPSLFRTVPSDRFQVQALVRVLREFGWNWVAFIGGDDDYSRDALQEFAEEIRSVDICLAYQGTITNNVSKIPAILDKLTTFNISVVLVFANQEYVVPFIEKAIERKVKKMWIASETWSLNQELLKKNGTETIGTILGIALGGIKTLQGFEQFVTRSLTRWKRAAYHNVSPAGVEDTCNQECHECLTADPKKILNKDPTYSFTIYSAVYAVAHALHRILQCGPQANPNKCSKCRKDEWSANGSVRCTKRSLEHLNYREPLTIGLLFSASFTLLSLVAVAALFACKYDTPVVRSAGGNMCFFMLSCLCLCAISVYFYVGRPGSVHCVLRNPAFAIFYTGCMSCLAIRSFQIVCIFKMASRLPRAYDYWVKHNGQWAAVAGAVAIQLFLCGLWMAVDGPQPITYAMGKQLVFDCSLGNTYIFNTIFVFLGLLSVACFGFAYMGTDLPKNYNEGKSITFSLLIFYISWTMCLTAHLTLKGKYLPAVNALSVLSTLLGILIGYFFPKCYIIIFKPDHNTAAYFQTAIQSYTIHSNT